jgi:hypothetical protein
MIAIADATIDCLVAYSRETCLPTWVMHSWDILTFRGISPHLSSVASRLAEEAKTSRRI